MTILKLQHLKMEIFILFGNQAHGMHILYSRVCLELLIIFQCIEIPSEKKERIHF